MADERTGEEIAAEVFFEAWMKKFRERVQLMVSPTSRGAHSAVMVQLVDRDLATGLIHVFSTTTIVLKADPWGKPQLEVW